MNHLVNHTTIGNVPLSEPIFIGFNIGTSRYPVCVLCVLFIYSVSVCVIYHIITIFIGFDLSTSRCNSRNDVKARS